MRLFKVSLAAILLVAYFFRWILICLITLIVMVNGGFFAGLGAGLFVWFILRFLYFFVFIYFGYKTLFNLRV